jgi:septal ring factor EnvC (AmiA/AmiB activator)
MTWEIFLGIGALISFVIAITGPMLKLNTSITKLNSSVDVLKEAIDKIDEDNEKSHKRIWEHNDKQDKLISENTQRIVGLEHKIDILHPEILGLHK